MRLPQILVLLASSRALTASSRPARRSYDTHDYYVIHHNPVHGHTPEQSAAALEAEFVEQAGELKDHYLIRIKKRPSSLLEGQSPGDPQDPVLESLDNLRRDSHPLSLSVRSVHPQTLRQRVKRAPIPSLPDLAEVESSLGIHDPLFPSQWHIINSEHPRHMMNVTGLWKEGITGKGVISALIDDGLDYESDDLKGNFYAPGSYDFNDHHPLPKPILDDDRHGTRCAGEIAAAKNDACGVGLAYDSKVAGLRILSAPITDVDESAAINYGYQENAIYSCSWGPPDTGRAMEGPNLLIRRAVLNGINNGRGGKGSIFVFASGNGASFGDACNFDGYTNSIYSVTVGAIDHTGAHPHYSESCAAVMVVAYSSGSGKRIQTTDVGKRECTHSHGGTSAAAPLAVGVFALALDVRPDLTWRDIQHLCVYSAVQVNPDDRDWELTASGRPFSYKYGFGKLDAYAYVTMARTWELVKPQVWMELPTIELAGGTMVGKEMRGGEPIVPGGVSSSRIITQDMLEEWNFESLEHITVNVWIKHTRRGDVEVELVSPAGVRSVLATPRRLDSAETGFVGWTFMTLKHWDENPVGKWTLKVSDQSNHERGNFLGWSMTLWGSAIDPSLAEKFELVDEPKGLHNLTSHISPSGVTTHHPRPTAHLPADHGSQTGPPTGTPTASPGNTPNGIFLHIYDLIARHLWLTGMLGIGIVFSAAVGLFFSLRRRRLQRLRGSYMPLPGGHSIPMRSLGERDGTTAPASGDGREPDGTFSIGSDDEEGADADERSALTGGAGRLNQAATPLAYHDGFLDDGGMRMARTSDMPYRDAPEAVDVTVASVSRGT